MIFAQSVSSAPTLACSHWPETCPLSRPLWDLDVGALKEESCNQNVLEKSGPGGLQRAFSRCCVDMAVPTPTTCLQLLVTQWPFSQEKTPQGACSVTVMPIVQPETDKHSSCSTFYTPSSEAMCTIKLSPWLLVGHSCLYSVCYIGG